MSDKMTKTRDVERYYDFIYLWTQLTNRFRAFDEPAAHTIHRPLVDPVTGAFETEVVHRQIADAVRHLAPIEGLDAGCGYGGTMMALSTALGGRWHGVTINRHQHRLAVRNAVALGYDNSVSFALASYDAPLTQTGAQRISHWASHPAPAYRESSRSASAPAAHRPTGRAR